MGDQRYLTTNEVAALCRTSPETLRYWRNMGRGPSWFKIGRRVLYEADEVQEWIDSLKTEIHDQHNEREGA